MTTSIRRRLIAIAVGMVVVFGVPATARAHAVLESSSPAASSTVAESPSRIELRFNETVEKSLASIRLFDDSRREIRIGDAVRPDSDPVSVRVDDLPVLDDGVYVVIWRVTSADGHPATGAFAFQVGTGPSTIGAGTVDSVVGGLDVKSDLGVPLGFAKFLAYVGVLVLVGAVVFSWRSTLASHARVLAVQGASLAALTLGSVGVLLFQGAYVSGRSWSSVFDGTLIDGVLSTRLGVAVAVRLMLCLGWIILLVVASRGGGNSSWWSSATVLTVIGSIATFAVSGHASALTWAPMFVAVDALHLASVGAWAGALVVFGVLVRARDVDLTLEAARFSRMSTWTMPIAVVTGLISGLKIAGGPGSIVENTYGRILAVKVIVVLVVIALGARARRRLRDGASGSTLRRTVRLEASLVLVVLAVTALLVGTSPNPAPRAERSFEVQLVQSDVYLDLQVVPARVGTAEIHALFTPPEGTLAPVKKVSVSLALQSGDVPPIPVKMIELGPNHWSGVVKIPFPGSWRVEVRASPKENVNLLFAANADINR